MTRVAIITNVIPSYRGDFYCKLRNRFGSKLTIYCQDHIPGINLETVHNNFSENVRIVRYMSIAKERLSWQWLPFKELWSGYDIYFFYGNPRVLSNVLLATLLRLKGKKVVIWGQRHTAGSNRILEFMRLRWWSLFQYIFLYTDRGADSLRKGSFKSKSLIGMNNGLNQETIDMEAKTWSAPRLDLWRVEIKLEDCVIFISCARLEPKNSFGIALESIKIVTEINPKIRWIVIGDGPELSSLQKLANEMELSNHVRWLGAIYEESLLAPWFLAATALIHPGSIGLSLLHAYGYGLPVITHDNEEQHMPEISALAESNQSLLFREADAKDLADKILRAVNDENLCAEISNDALNIARFKYNTAVMADRFCSVIAAAGLELPGSLSSDRRLSP